MTDDEFIAECAFAKVVETSAGAAILVAGEVIRVSGPEGVFGRSKRDYADLLSRALRIPGGRDAAGAGTLANTPTAELHATRNQPVNEIGSLLSGSQGQNLNLTNRLGGQHG